MKNDTKTMALLLANCAVDYEFEDAYDAVGALVDQFVEDFCPEVELTEIDVVRLKTAYEAIVYDYVDDANVILNEWAENAREDQETREDALRSAYGTC